MKYPENQKECVVLTWWDNATILGVQKHEFGIPRFIFLKFDAKGSGRNATCPKEWQQLLAINQKFENNHYI